MGLSSERGFCFFNKYVKIYFQFHRICFYLDIELLGCENSFNISHRFLRWLMKIIDRKIIVKFEAEAVSEMNSLESRMVYN